MKNFVYSIPTKVFFGKGQIEKIGPEVLKYGKRSCWFMEKEVLNQMEFTIKLWKY
ncbi:MAG: hypothetical protein ACLTQH_01680 [Fusobacterium sp.]